MSIVLEIAAAVWRWSQKGWSRTKMPALDLINNLSDDVLIEIFIRLPNSRSAIQCGAVCKHWNNLIAKNPQFIHAFISHPCRRGCTSRHRGFTLQKGPLPYQTFILSSKKPDHVPMDEQPINFFDFVGGGTGRIRASFNELLLLSSSTDYFIFSTMTGWWVMLPPPPHLPPYPRFFGLVCKLSRADVMYRVVLLDKHPSHIQVSVFSSETQNWTTFAIDYQTDVIGAQPDSHYDSVVARGGILYLNCPYARWSILALDPFSQAPEKQTSDFRFVALPRRMSTNTVVTPLEYLVEFSLGVCQDRVRASKLYFGNTEQWPYNHWLMLEAWELKEDESCWSFVHTLHFGIRQPIHGIMRARFHPNDPDVLFFSCLNSVYRHNIKEDTMTRVADVPIQYTPDIIGFKELTMFSLDEPCWPTPAPTPLPVPVTPTQLPTLQQKYHLLREITIRTASFFFLLFFLS